VSIRYIIITFFLKKSTKIIEKILHFYEIIKVFSVVPLPECSCFSAVDFCILQVDFCMKRPLP